MLLFTLAWPCFLTDRIIDADKESAKLDEKAVDAILLASNGDMRKAVTYLQSCHQLTINMHAAIDEDMVLDITGKVPERLLLDIWNAANGYSLDILNAIATELIVQGYPLSSVLAQLMVQISSPTVQLPVTLTDVDRALIAERIAEVGYFIYILLLQS
ncbi:hypothetical protein EON65_00460 [archaeon]|nr:MAG: hypothetical protein EON65_00460 [archaeon]